MHVVQVGLHNKKGRLPSTPQRGVNPKGFCRVARKHIPLQPHIMLCCCRVSFLHPRPVNMSRQGPVIFKATPMYIAILYSMQNIRSPYRERREKKSRRPNTICPRGCAVGGNYTSRSQAPAPRRPARDRRHGATTGFRGEWPALVLHACAPAFCPRSIPHIPPP